MDVKGRRESISWLIWLTWFHHQHHPRFGGFCAQPLVTHPNKFFPFHVETQRETETHTHGKTNNRTKILKTCARAYCHLAEWKTDILRLSWVNISRTLESWFSLCPGYADTWRVVALIKKMPERKKNVEQRRMSCCHEVSRPPLLPYFSVAISGSESSTILFMFCVYSRGPFLIRHSSS